nr:MAG TPA: Chitin-binding domain type 3 [Caudoviricetes sp.]
MAQIVLNNGHLYTLDFIRPNQIGKSCRLEDIKMIIEDMAQENISGATVKDEPSLTKMGNLKLNSFSVDFNPKDEKYNITIFFDEVPQSEIDLAKERAKNEAMRLCAVAGLNVLSPKFVIQWREFLDPWNGYKFPYKKGERFQYKDKPYEVIEDVVSSNNEPPEKAPRFYKEVTAEAPREEYDKNKTYQAGNIVRYNGKLWISKWNDNRNHDPGISSAWKEWDGK